jgi:UDP-N-acetylmuramoyl-tripeptide--D-alanyl-D-alanine ligase
MEPRSLAFISAACGGQVIHGTPEAMVNGFTTDSRQVQPGTLFLALAGERFDGHNFLEQVVQQGAGAVVVNRNKARKLSCAVIAVDDTRKALGALAARYRADFQVQGIAVGGSNGKTTTKEILATLLKQKLSTLWSEASFNNDIGVPLTLLKLTSQHKAAVLEVGTNHHGELQPLLAMVQPRMCVLTSIGREHLEFFQDLAGVAQEEGFLAEMTPVNGRFFTNGDSEWTSPIARRCRGAVVRAGFSEGNDWRASHIRMDVSGNTFDVKAPTAAYSGEYRISLIGRHQVTNALLAMAVAAEMGLSPAEIRSGLAECKPAKMRLQIREFNGIHLLDDAYNANADSMRAALQTLRDFPCQGKRVAVLGEMAELGSETAPAHREIGRFAAELGIDSLVAVGPAAAETAASAREGGLSNVWICEDAVAAAKHLRAVVKPGDALLLKASRAAGLERVSAALMSIEKS